MLFKRAKKKKKYQYHFKVPDSLWIIPVCSDLINVELESVTGSLLPEHYGLIAVCISFLFIQRFKKKKNQQVALERSLDRTEGTLYSMTVLNKQPPDRAGLLRQAVSLYHFNSTWPL